MVRDLTILGGILVILALVLSLIFGINMIPKPEVNIQISSEKWPVFRNDTDRDAEAVEKILALGYSVDVEINSNHISLHPESSDALRCAFNNGTVSVFSEKMSGRLHLLCWDETTNRLFDIIINRINFYVKKWSNPKSNLITAYSPEGVNGITMTEKVSFYLEHLKTTISGKVVNLSFGPGEIMFIPK